MPGVGSTPTAAAAATMVAVGLCGWAVRPDAPRGFVAPTPPAVGGSSPAVVAGSRPRVAAAAEEASSAAPKAAAAAAAALALFGGLVARRGARRTDSSVAMRATRKYFRPNSKGYKPLVQRMIARGYMKRYLNHAKNMYKTQDDVEEMMKKSMYGSFRFDFASPHFVDEIPWVGPGADPSTQRKRVVLEHQYDDPFYVRKFLEPAKFKKLEIVAWEMPENFTKAVTMQELVQAGMQYGHSAHHWNQKMIPYLYSNMDGTHIFDLVQTAAQMNRACYYIMEAASKGATFLFTGTKEQAGPLIKDHATRCGAWYTDIRFTGGLLTNKMLIGKGVKLYLKLKRQAAQGAWKSDSPVEQEKNRLALIRLGRKYAGVADMDGFPDIMIVVDPVKERAAVAEACANGIPVIALCDSNANPKNIDIPVPGNASGQKSIELFLHKITEAINLGLALRNKTAPGDQEVVKPEWDPWLFSQDRLRYFRRRSLRQPWMKEQYGGYEAWKKAHPYGNIPSMVEFRKFSWQE